MLQVAAALTLILALAANGEPRADEWFSIGQSVQGRTIQAIRLGSGGKHLALMGSIHGGWERNTMVLVQTAYEFLRDNPLEIPDGLTV